MVKRYYVVNAQPGSNLVLVRDVAERKLADELAVNVAGGTAFVLEGYHENNPAVSGGLSFEDEVEVAVKAAEAKKK